MSRTDVPAPALVEMPDGTYSTVEAPRCGNRLDLDSKGVHLTCDRIEGHTDEIGTGRHRAVLPVDHPVFWCGDECASMCSGPLSALAMIRAAEKEIRP